jgi:hypothetical protein
MLVKLASDDVGAADRSKRPLAGVDERCRRQGEGEVASTPLLPAAGG